MTATEKRNFGQTAWLLGWNPHMNFVPTLRRRIRSNFVIISLCLLKLCQFYGIVAKLPQTNTAPENINSMSNATLLSFTTHLLIRISTWHRQHNKLLYRWYKLEARCSINSTVDIYLEPVTCLHSREINYVFRFASSFVDSCVLEPPTGPDTL